ncbi:hypothetical protein [Streptomyces wuyuanensis]|uniref:hypothetical protein n=1 Tax=Streptomyces wuyuanensis TaxID=1196353 RepID=UPI003D74502C
MFTLFTELDTLLTGFTRSVRDILGDTSSAPTSRAPSRWAPAMFTATATSSSPPPNFDPPRPGSLDATYAFAVYAESFAG